MHERDIIGKLLRKEVHGDDFFKVYEELTDAEQIEYERQYMLKHLSDYLTAGAISLEEGPDNLRERQQKSIVSIAEAKSELEKLSSSSNKDEEDIRDAQRRINQLTGWNLAVQELIEKYSSNK